MPEKIATLCFSIFRSARAIWIAFRIPKSPQPGHQSLWTSVWKSAGLSSTSGAIAQHLPRRGLAVENRRQTLDELVARHRPPLELHDAVGDPDPCVLADEPRQRGTVVHLHVDNRLASSQEFRDRLRRERMEEAELEESNLATRGLQRRHRVEECALRRSPAHDDGLRVLVSMERVLILDGDLFGGEVELAHALVHHRDANDRVLRDVARLVVLVARVPEDRPGHAEHRARANAAWRARKPFVPAGPAGAGQPTPDGST